MSIPAPRRQQPVSKRLSSGAVLTLVPELPEDAPRSPKARRLRIRRWIRWSAILGILAALLVGTGVALHRQLQDRAARDQAKKALGFARLDTPEGYRQALAVLDQLARRRPSDPWVAVARAEVLVDLWGRYVGDDAMRQAARDALAVAARGARSSQDGLLAGVLGRSGERLASRVEGVTAKLLLYEGKWEEALRVAEAARLEQPDSPRLGYLVGSIRARRGDLAAAEAILRLACAKGPRMVPAHLALARVLRLRGRFDAAAQQLALVQRLSPGHLLLRVERTLLRLTRGESVPWRDLARLARDATPYSAVLARVRLAEATAAWQHGELQRARALLDQAAAAAPRDLEIGLALIASKLGPGGDVDQAWSLRTGVRQRSRELLAAPLLWAEIAVAVGRPDEAARWMQRVDGRALPPSLSGRRQRIATELAASMRDLAAVRMECRRVLEQGVTAGVAMPPERPVPPWRVPEFVLRPAARSSAAGKGASAGPEKVPREALLGCLRWAAETRDRRTLSRLARRLPKPLSALAAGLRDLVSYRDAKAEASLAAVVRQGAAPAWVWSALARALIGQERPRSALPALQRAVHASGGAVAERIAHAQGLSRAGRATAARRVVDALVRQEITAPWALSELGRLAHRIDHPGAVARLAEALDRHWVNLGEGPYLRGLLALRRRGGTRAARAHFEEALRREPTHVAAALALGRLALHRGDAVAAQGHFEQALRPRERRPEVALAVARAYFDAGRVRAARKAYVKAALLFRLLGARRRAADVLSELGHRLGRVKGYRRRTVERILRWALQISERSAWAHLRLGQFRRAQGRRREALAHLRRAASLGPEIAEVHFALGAALQARRAEGPAAEGALSRFLDLTSRPRGRRARQARAWLRRLALRRR